MKDDKNLLVHPAAPELIAAHRQSDEVARLRDALKSISGGFGNALLTETVLAQDWRAAFIILQTTAKEALLPTFDHYAEEHIDADDEVKRLHSLAKANNDLARHNGDEMRRLQAENGRLKDALDQSLWGWENVAELSLIPERYMDGAIKLAKVCRAALEPAK